MCVTTAEAALYATYLGIWDIEHPTEGYRHLLAYQNVPRNLSQKPNSMLLPIPTKEALKPEHLLDTSEDPDVLKEMTDPFIPVPLSAEFSRAQDPHDVNAVFEMGIYHIVMLNELSHEALEACLAKVPEEKRPEISEDMFRFYQETYPDYPLLICCFSTRKMKETSPIMIHFAPAHPETFMLNFLEAHGEVPILGERVIAHQKVLVASSKVKEAFGDYQPIRLGDLEVSEHLKEWLPNIAQGEYIQGPIPNYDMLIDNSQMAESDQLEVKFGILK